MINKIKLIVRNFKQEIKVYKLILKDVRTPKLGKFLLGLAVTYVLSPIDIIPDFIPVIGYFDDIIIVPVLVILALKTIPKEVVIDCRNKVNSNGEINP